jgi:hypothetical protein
MGLPKLETPQALPGDALEVRQFREYFLFLHSALSLLFLCFQRLRERSFEGASNREAPGSAGGYLPERGVSN